MKNITIHRLFEDNPIFKIIPLRIKRKWMFNTKNKFAYECVPLNVANQYGWAVLSPTDFSISWWGGVNPDDVEIHIKEDDFKHNFLNYFGESIFTIHPDFIIQTPENYSTYIRGIPNGDKRGIKYLDAIVETDWLPFTFTYNIQLMEPGTYNFKKGEPLFTFFPIERNTVENFELKEQNLINTEDLNLSYLRYAKHSSERFEDGSHENLYRKGVDPDGKKYNIKNHIVKLIFGGKSDKLK